MTNQYEIIRSGIRQGTIAECFQLPNVRCLTGVQPDVWLIQGRKSVLAFMNLAKCIYSNKKINDNYTIGQVQKVLDGLILESIKDPGMTQETIIEKAKKQLPTSGAQSFDIMRNIFGIRVSRYRELQPFIFQKRNNVFRRYFSGKGWNTFKGEISDYVVRCRVTSVSNERAVEMADNAFVALEYLFAFFLGRKDSGYEVRIIHPTKENSIFHLAKSDDGQLSMGVARSNLVHRNIDLDDKFFRKDKIRQLFSVIVTPHGSIENRLKKAITWIGKGLFAEASTDSIIFYSSALEALLIRDKNAVISPSILSSLAEYCAFLLGRTKIERQDIASKVKAVYSERSAGTHGGKVTSDSVIEGTAAGLSRAMVFKLLELYPNKVKTEDNIIQFVDRLKYS